MPEWVATNGHIVTVWARRFSRFEADAILFGTSSARFRTFCTLQPITSCDILIICLCCLGNLQAPNFLTSAAMSDQVKVSVPATAANMGPGFDSLGMALDIWNTVEVEVGSSGFSVCGEGEDTLPRDENNLVYRCFSLLFQEAGIEVPPVHITCRNEIPLARGLGSSSAAAVAGLMAGNEICGRPLSRDGLLELAAKTEGHPDNVAPALLGGCQIVVREEDRLVTAAVQVPEDLQAVVFIPDMRMPTDRARGLLSDKVALEDAVYNIGRVALLVGALASGDLSKLAVATEDRLHQPPRQTLFPAMKNIFRAALDAGALGVFLSGAGSSVLALTRGKELTIGYEMADAAVKSRVDGTLTITKPTSVGAHLVEGDGGVPAQGESASWR